MIHKAIKSKLTTGMASFDKQPSKKVLNAVRGMMDLAYTELKKLPKVKKK